MLPGEFGFVLFRFWFLSHTWECSEVIPGSMDSGVTSGRLRKLYRMLGSKLMVDHVQGKYLLCYAIVSGKFGGDIFKGASEESSGDMELFPVISDQ